MEKSKNCHVQTRLTHDLKKKLKQRFKRLIVNRELIEFIEGTVKELPSRDKLAGLHYFKKLAVQVFREPDPDHYKVFKDVYDEEMSAIKDEQKHFEPVKWINAEIEYLTNTGEHLTVEDVNHRLDIMQEAKQRLSKDWLTKGEVMDLFHISKSTLSRRIAEGLPCCKKGKFVYFYLKDINEWMEKDAA